VLQLLGDRLLITHQRSALLARTHHATLDVDQQIHFPSIKGVALQFTLQKILHEPIEADAHRFATAETLVNEVFPHAGSYRRGGHEFERLG
jgi:hypothetical protein